MIIKRSKIYYYIYKLTVTLFILLLLTSHLSPLTSVYADGVNLSVSPSLLQIKATTPADVRAPISIENKADESVNIQIGLKLFKDSGRQDGQIQYLGISDTGSGPDKDIFNKIQVVDDGAEIDTLSLGPKQKKNLELRILLPNGEPPADYYFSVVFIGNPTDESTQTASQDNTSVTASAIGLNVLLAIGPQAPPEGYINEFSSPFYVDSGPVPFTVKVKNQGIHFISPKALILIKNMFGQTVGRIDIPTSNILANSSRLLNSKVQANTANNSPDIASPKVIWPEKFLLGFYTADLSLMVGDQGPVYERTIHFVAFPIKLLITIIIVMLIILFIYLRVKKKLKEE